MLTFNGQDKDYIHSIQDIRTHYGPARTIEREGIPGGRGARLRRVTDAEKVFELDITILPKNGETFQEVADDMVRWLYHDEPKPVEFPDNPGRYYDVMMEGGIDRDEIIYFAKCTLTFVSLDGLSYTTTPYENTAISDVVDVVNNGTAETDFILKATAIENSTMFMVTKGDKDYFMIGKPTDAYKEDVDIYPTIWSGQGANFQTFTKRPSGILVGEGLTSQYNTGSMSRQVPVDAPGNTIYPDWGTTTRESVFHGPVYRKALPHPVGDFHVRTAFKMERWGDGSGIGKAFTHLYDEEGRIFASYGMIDTNTSTADVHILVRIYTEDGGYEELFYSKGYSHSEPYDDRWMWVSIERAGSLFIVKTWHIYTENGIKKTKNNDRITFRDNQGLFSRKVAIGEVAMATHSRYTDSPYIRIARPRLNDRLDLDDVVPHLIKAGDEVLVDTKQSLVLLNDEPIGQEKDFGSNYFKLDKGLNRLAIEPAGKFDTTVEWFDKFL